MLMPRWRPLAMLAALLFPLIRAGAAAPTDDLERLALLHGRSADGWQAVEGTITPTTLEGTPAIAFRVEVNWLEGEKGYPIGWPRMQMNLPKDRADWRKWERIRVKVYARTSRGSLPHQPLGLTLSAGGRNANWERDFEGLGLGRWQEYVFDLSDLALRDRVDSVGLFISESNYQHGDVLEFFIADVELLRYTRPTLISLEPRAKLVFADDCSLGAAVTMLGVPAGASAPIQVRLEKGGRAFAGCRAEVAEGTGLISLRLPKPPPTGDYTLVASDGKRELRAGVKLITSPWQGGAR